MKTKLKIVLLTAMFAAGITLTNAQTKDYKGGNVWQVSFIKTKPNMTVEYVNSLKANWKKSHDEAVKQGLILSYKILNGTAANPDDWDVMLMVEYKNLAAMEGNDEKWEAITKNTIGGEETMKTINQGRVNVREIYGSKVLREVIYK